LLAHQADLARETWQWVDQLASDWIAAHVRGLGSTRRIELAALATLPSALRRAAMWQVMKDTGRPMRVDFAHVSRALEVATPGGPPRVDAPGLRVVRVGRDVVLTSRGLEEEQPERFQHGNHFRYALSVPGEVRRPGGGWVIAAESVNSTESAELDRCAISGNGPLALVRGDRFHGVLAVRNRQFGDRFQPFGLTGHKK